MSQCHDLYVFDQYERGYPRPVQGVHCHDSYDLSTGRPDGAVATGENCEASEQTGRRGKLPSSV
jgi:hypothetical protein